MESISITLQLPSSAEEVFNAWIDPVSHRDFTGGNAVIDARNGGHYAVWDGYITGIILKLEPYHRIVKSWRTTDYHPMDPSSMVEVLLDDNENGCLLTINQTEIPKGQSKTIEAGWRENYFVPMLGYFSFLAEKKKRDGS